MKATTAALGPYAISSYLSIAVWVALTALALFALAVCLLRPSKDFGLARKTKAFWLTALGVGLAVMIWPYIVPIGLPFSSWFRLAAVVAAVYYLGPEQQRMGSWRRNRRGGSGRGGW